MTADDIQIVIACVILGAAGGRIAYIVYPFIFKKNR